MSISLGGVLFMLKVRLLVVSLIYITKLQSTTILAKTEGILTPFFSS
jgi:hypothetical protein